ncbi:MAG: stage III sporulation protein AF [Eubacteriales bacterium]|nr:stage III sporulation protein AF [Eubacteriales bacterium]
MQWIKNIICSVCILGALLHVIPDSTYRKYANFYAGLLILLMVLKPLTSIFSLDEPFDRLVQVQELKRELAELNMTWTGMEELGTQKVEEAWKKELEHQIEEAARLCDLSVEKMKINLKEDEEGIIADLSVSIQTKLLYPSKENGEEKKEEMVKMLEEIYELDRNKIQITVQE